MANEDQHKTQALTRGIIQHYPQYYFPTQLFVEEKYSPMLYFNVTTPVVSPETVRQYELSGPMEEEPLPDRPARITILGAPRLSMNLIAHCIQARLDLFDLHYSIASDGMTYLDINATLMDLIQDPRRPYMVNHKTPAQLIVQGSRQVSWILHNDICDFLTSQLHGKSMMFPERNHFLIKSIRPIACNDL